MFFLLSDIFYINSLKITGVLFEEAKEVVRKLRALLERGWPSKT
jgi:hypothetical protein